MATQKKDAQQKKGYNITPETNKKKAKPVSTPPKQTPAAAE